MKQVDEDTNSNASKESRDNDTSNVFGNETELLEKVVQKLVVLSEITMNKNVVDAETMEGLGEGDRAVIHGFQGSSGTGASAWGMSDSHDDENEDENFESML